jgi:hypothetical protein
MAVGAAGTVVATMALVLMLNKGKYGAESWQQ